MICLGSVEDIPEGGAKGFEWEGEGVFGVKQDGQVFLYRNRCPHLGTPLEWQEDGFLDPDGTLIQCSTHGALFAIDNGLCLQGPCRGQSLQAVKFWVDNGLLMVDEAQLRGPAF